MWSNSHTNDVSKYDKHIVYKFDEVFFGWETPTIIMNNVAIASIYQYNHVMVHCIIDATKIPLIECVWIH